MTVQMYWAQTKNPKTKQKKNKTNTANVISIGYIVKMTQVLEYWLDHSEI